MEQVIGFKADDGTIFDDKAKCLDHDLLIFFRSIVNDGKGRGQTAEIALRANQDHIYDTLQTHRRRMSAMAKAAAKR